MILRSAVTADARTLSLLHGRAFEIGWPPAELEALLTGPGGMGLVIEKEGAVAGFLLLRVMLDEAEILTIAVDPDLRRSGVGLALVEASAALAAAAGAERLFLEVAVDNDAAIALYRRAGFEKAGLRARYYRRVGREPVDALVLRRSLNTDTA
jgi:ribosomal-protein-alanine N-acetyltransferase